MPKMKTNRGAAKRFKMNKNGKIKRKKAFRNHILTKKSAGRKRALRGIHFIAEADEKEVRRLLKA